MINKKAERHLSNSIQNRSCFHWEGYIPREDKYGNPYNGKMQPISVQSNPLNGSEVGPVKYWTHERIEPLSGDPLSSGLDCTPVPARSRCCVCAPVWPCGGTLAGRRPRQTRYCCGRQLQICYWRRETGPWSSSEQVENAYKIMQVNLTRTRYTWIMWLIITLIL